MKKNNPKLKPGELEKKAAAQAKLETKKVKGSSNTQTEGGHDC
jgi:hypothetical protein